MRRLMSFLAMLFTVLAVIFFALPSIQDANLGIEFKGGYEVVYEVGQKEGVELPEASDIADVIAERIDIAGVKNPQVNTEQVPGSTSTYIRVCVTSEDTTELAEILTLIESDCEVTFTDSEGNIKMLGSDVLADEDGAVLSYQDGSPIVLLNIKDTDIFSSVTEELSGSNMMAWIGYEDASDDYIGDYQAYIGNGTEEQQATAAKKLIVNATVNEEISSSTATITGSFTANEASQIGKLLSAGSMTFELTRTDILKVDGSFGASAFNRSIIAGLVGLIAIIILMIALYKIPGIISSITLVFYTAIILVIFNKIGGEYGPDTIAAIVIGLGMAVDCCIILFERLNDELYKGRSLKAAYEESTKKSLSAILDSNITTIIAACALYFFGKRSVKGFATMLLITTVFNVLIMLLITRLLMFLLVKSGKFDNKKSLFGVKESEIPDINKGETQKYFGKFHNVNFVKSSKKFGFGYLGVLVAALIALGCSFAFGYGNGHGLNFGLDFLTGTTATININDVEGLQDLDKGGDLDLSVFCGDGNEFSLEKFNDANPYGISEDSIKEFLVTYCDYTIEPVSVSVTSGKEDGAYTLAIKIEYDEDFSDIQFFEEKVQTATGLEFLDDKGSEFITISQQTTSPTMAIATVINALLSLLVAFGLIIVYIAIRFRYTYAIASVAALFIDVLFTIAIFVIFQVEVETDFVSAILAIIGYSINDTVVIFDRIREIAKETNYGHISDEDRYNIVNKAVSNCATRSIWTTVSTVLPVLALIFIGSDSTLAFCIAMLAGLISGLISSMIIAPSLWLVLEKKHMIRLHEKAIRDSERIASGKNRPTEQEELTVIGIND